MNEKDFNLARAVTAPDVAIGGPRGQATGQHILAEWIGHAGIRLVPLSIKWQGDRAIVAQEATWPDNSAADTSAPPLRVYTVFTFHSGLIAGIARLDSEEDLRMYLDRSN